MPEITKSGHLGQMICRAFVSLEDKRHHSTGVTSPSSPFFHLVMLSGSPPANGTCSSEPLPWGGAMQSKQENAVHDRCVVRCSSECADHMHTMVRDLPRAPQLRARTDTAHRGKHSHHCVSSSKRPISLWDHWGVDLDCTMRISETIGGEDVGWALPGRRPAAANLACRLLRLSRPSTMSVMTRPHRRRVSHLPFHTASSSGTLT